MNEAGRVRVRARDLGIVIGEGRPGRNNAITDVAGVRVGHATIVEGEGPLVRGRGPIRTGVTVIVTGAVSIPPWPSPMVYVNETTPLKLAGGV